MNPENVFIELEQEYGKRFNDKQKKLCIKFARSWNKREALKFAGYRPKDTQTAFANLWAKPWIREACERIREEYFYSIGMKESNILKNIIGKAFFDPNILLDKNGQLKKITDLPKNVRQLVKTIDEEGRPTKFNDPKAYMNMLMRNKSMFNDKVVIGLTREMVIGLIATLPDDYKEAAKEYLERLIVE